MRGALVDRLISVAVLVLGIAVSVITARLPSAGGYARIGPNFMPTVVGIGLIVVGIWLLVESFAGGWRNRAPDDPAERGEHAFHLPGFAWVTAGLVAQMALINTAGFVIAATALFACVARGFGNTRWVRNLAYGFTIGLAIFLFFVKLLNVNLPAGWLLPLLGSAGI
jgi:putative tricarboxylic transport membrane protein